ncbi:MAG: helix-turn-helix domain-containing protein [Bacteriovoracaceae bacterium]
MLTDLFCRKLNMAIEDGTSLTEISKRTGIPKSTLWRYAQKLAVPKLDTVEAIARSLGQSGSEFLYEKDQATFLSSHQKKALSDFIYSMTNESS